MLIDRRRSLFELFAFLRLFELFDCFFRSAVNLCETGIQEKGWAEKCAAISDEIEGLGEGYHDALCYGWVKSLSAAYPPGSKMLPLDLSIVQTKVVVEDDDV